MSKKTDTGWRVAGEMALARLLHRYFMWRKPLLPVHAGCEPELFTFGSPAREHGRIPAIIWAFWNDANVPLTVQRCILSWRRHNPHFEIRLLTDATLHEWVGDIPDGLAHATVQQKSDWLRLALLYRYGGIWVDASTILTAPLDWALQGQASHACDMVGFYLQRFTTQPHCPVVENWFMAAPPGTAFMAAVLDEFTTQVIAQGSTRYVAHLKALGIYESVVQQIDSPEYLSMHLCIQRVLQREDASYSLLLQQAEKTAFWLHELAGWNRAGLKLRLFFMQKTGAMPALIKLRGPDRRKLDLYLQQKLYIPHSIAATDWAGQHQQEAPDSGQYKHMQGDAS